MSLTLDDLRSHLNMSEAQVEKERSELERVLAAATKVVEHRCGPLQARTVTVQGWPTGRMMLLPAIQVAAVEAVRDPQGVAVDPALCVVNLFAGIITLPSAPVGGGVWEVDIRTGAQGPAPDLELAVLIIAAHLWETQRGRGQERSEYYPSADGSPQAPPMGFAVPARAAELMRPYVIPDLV